MTDKLHYLFFIIAVIGLFVGGFALASVQSAHDKIDNFTIEIPVVDVFDWRNNTEFWEFINDNYVSEQEHNVTKADIELNFDEITKNKLDIKKKFPQGSAVEEEPQSVIADTPFLTLKMDKTEFLLGEKIIFRGNAHPNDPVLITIKRADRTLEQHAVSKTEIINGQYVTEFPTRFDDIPGTWSAYARQGSDQTKTLTFKVL